MDVRTCAENGIEVLLDVHAMKDSQNGFDKAVKQLQSYGTKIHTSTLPTGHNNVPTGLVHGHVIRSTTSTTPNSSGVSMLLRVSSKDRVTTVPSLPSRQSMSHG